ncbi:hypothetical protein [Roseicitreum antarcticum]|nr:hypothetical protein [Roseicitreum antarcticum]
MSYDADRWNSRHADERQIELDLDLNFDVELRKHAADAEDEVTDD